MTKRQVARILEVGEGIAKERDEARQLAAELARALRAVCDPPVEGVNHWSIARRMLADPRVKALLGTEPPCTCEAIREAMVDGHNNPEGNEEYRQEHGHYFECEKSLPKPPDWTTCPRCNGSGRYSRVPGESFPCAICEGTGRIAEPHDVGDTFCGQCGANLSSPQPAPSPWIPVSERLPCDGEEVLVITRHNFIFLAPWDGEKDYFEDACEGGELKAKVTHWMPLPAPPEPQPK